ncbi:MAG: YdcH family protein [Magnetococcales bacterium]|nr:YdcH family protein [Magnetococcales bacterium]
MFEDQLQAVQELLDSDEEFRVLHAQHQALKNKIAEVGPLNYVDYTVERMKKEKLLIKDRMATILQRHTQDRI